MAVYKCFFCGKELTKEQLRGKMRCPYCGSKILYKPRQVTKKIKAI